MPRTEKQRLVETPPLQFKFKSLGKNNTNLKIELHLDEFEAIRLADLLQLTHSEAAKIMGISRPTFTRLLEKAHKKTSAFFIDGGELEIKGGKIMFSSNVYCCRTCHRPFCWDSESTPVCPNCSGKEALVPHSSCDGSCDCCESLSE
jgi:predicted DNA-binding protein (UPF0251 family)